MTFYMVLYATPTCNELIAHYMTLCWFDNIFMVIYTAYYYSNNYCNTMLHVEFKRPGSESKPDLYFFSLTLSIIFCIQNLVFCWNFDVKVVLISIMCVLTSQIGMVAWRLTMLTPEYPGGREVIIIANDLTYQIGSFGPLEDQLFKVTALGLHGLVCCMFYSDCI